MKARLISNGILSIIQIFLFISYFLVESWWFIIIWTIIAISNIVMGIVTLSLEKEDEIKGLMIASGVLAIFGGALGANAIVSFIAVHRLNNITDQQFLQEKDES